MKKHGYAPVFILGVFLCLATALSGFARAAYNQPAVFDFDGDGISDPVVIEDVNNDLRWTIMQSTDGVRTLIFGLSTMNDVAVPGDYDGDGKWDVAIWRPGSGADLWHGPSYFWILTTKGERTMVIPWGTFGDSPLATQDFDGDQVADLSVVRKENGQLIWWTMLSNGGISVTAYGRDTDHFVRGDYDGDGKADLAVFRPIADKSTPANTFIINRSSDQKVTYTTFGLAGDIIVPGDYDNDGATDIAVFRSKLSKYDRAAYWYVLRSSDGSVDITPFGLTTEDVAVQTDCPVPGDYDGDRGGDLGIWRMIMDPKTSSEFHMLKKKGGYAAFPFGMGHMTMPNYTLQTVDTTQSWK